MSYNDNELKSRIEKEQIPWQSLTKVTVANPPTSSGALEFWATYGPIITGGAVIVSAFCAIAVILTNRVIARKRATLDLILHIESDSDILKARNEFIGLKAGDQKSKTWGTKAQRDSSEAKTIRTILNINEMVAVSIKENVIHERVWRKWFNRAFIDDYKSMTGYIEEVRKYRENPAIFKELEELAKKWDADSSWYSHPSWISRKISAISAIIHA